MKNKRLRMLLLSALALCVLGTVIACTQTSDPEDTKTEGDTTTPDRESSAPTEEETTRAELVWESYDPALDNSAVDTSAQHKVDSSQWVAQDGLDRVLVTNTEAGDVR